MCKPENRKFSKIKKSFEKRNAKPHSNRFSVLNGRKECISIKCGVRKMLGNNVFAPKQQ